MTFHMTTHTNHKGPTQYRQKHESLLADSKTITQRHRTQRDGLCFFGNYYFSVRAGPSRTSDLHEAWTGSRVELAIQAWTYHPNLAVLSEKAAQVASRRGLPEPPTRMLPRNSRSSWSIRPAHPRTRPSEHGQALASTFSRLVLEITARPFEGFPSRSSKGTQGQHAARRSKS